MCEWMMSTNDEITPEKCWLVYIFTSHAATLLQRLRYNPLQINSFHEFSPAPPTSAARFFFVKVQDSRNI